MAELAELEDALRALLRSLQESQSALAPVRTSYEDAKSEADRLRQRTSDLEKTLATSTANARELSAIQNELVHLRELLERSEDRELELLFAVEPLDEAVASIKAQAQPRVARRGELQATITELQATLDEEIVALKVTRREHAAALSPELLVRYDSAMARVGTSGAAQVDAGRCDGCRIALSPLDHDRWKSQPAETFMTCPECGRLLLP
jgi:predicted  nucleic acid-binding Zn-ribbon protein